MRQYHLSSVKALPDHRYHDARKISAVHRFLEDAGVKRDRMDHESRFAYIEDGESKDNDEYGFQMSEDLISQR
jgi:hypothetical protein